jgi:hypothetical protein
MKYILFDAISTEILQNKSLTLNERKCFLDNYDTYEINIYPKVEYE